jgi:hypothetical protein
LLSTVAAYEWSNTGVLSKMDLKVGSCVVFLITALELTVELVDVLMCFLVISQNPFLSEFRLATWE